MALSGPRPAFSDEVAVARAPSARFVVAAWAGTTDTPRVATTATTVRIANRGVEGTQWDDRPRPVGDHMWRRRRQESAFTLTPRRRGEAARRPPFAGDEVAAERPQ